MGDYKSDSKEIRSVVHERIGLTNNVSVKWKNFFQTHFVGYN